MISSHIFKKTLIGLFGILLVVLTTNFLGNDARADEKEKAPVDTTTKTSSNDFKGTLYLIGGNASTSLKRFAELAGGEKALVAVIPHASSLPVEAADEIANQLKSYGVNNTVTILPNTKGVLPKGVTAVFMTGGDQNRLMRLIDKDLHTAIVEFLRDGGVVGGTSAGAAAASVDMIAGGMEDSLPKAGSLRMGKGLGLLKGWVIDTHVFERTRHDRSKVALLLVDNVACIGLDEDTAVEIKDGKATVHGAGFARIFQRGENFKSTLTGKKPDEKGSVRNVIESVVPAGEDFDL